MDSSDSRPYPKASAGNDTPRVGLVAPAAAPSAWPTRVRRASRFLQSESESIGAMERNTGRPSKGPRASVIFRMPTPLRIQTQQVLDQLGATLNDFVEHLAVVDLAHLPADQENVTPTTLASRRTGKTGRPSKGPRITVVLRVSHELAEQVKVRAAALGLSVNDYLDSLVSHDITAHRATGEGMVLDQSA